MSLRNGPLNKSFYTQFLELIAKCLIRYPEKIKLLSHTDGTFKRFELNIDGCLIDLSNLFKKANFSHLALNAADSQAYIKHFKLRTPVTIKNKLPHLTEAEKITINAYSGYSEAINAMLYGKLLFDHELKTVIDCIMLASGLNKLESITMYNIPDKIPNALLPPLRTYRGEVYMTPEIIKQRIDLVNAGGGITQQHGFMSTSYKRAVSKNFSQNTLIIFEKIYGKDIAPLANNQKEHEYLLVPSQIYWYKFEQVGDNITFYGRIVEPLNEVELAPVQAEIESFKTLFNWVATHQIETDFLNAYLKEWLGLPVSPQPQVQPKTQVKPPVQKEPIQENTATFAPSMYPKSMALLIGAIVLLSSFCFGFSMPFIIASTVLSSLATYTALLLRESFYENAYANKHEAFIPSSPSMDHAAFQHGCSAAKGWKPYFTSFFEKNNWTHFSDYAAGYQSHKQNKKTFI